MTNDYSQAIKIESKSNFDCLNIGDSFVKPDFDILVVYVKTSQDRAIDIASARDVKIWDTGMPVLTVSYSSVRATTNV